MQEQITILLSTTTAELAGTVSDDGLPSGTLSVSWSEIDSPPGGTAAFTDPSSATPPVSFDAAGFYTLRLSTSDGDVSLFDDVLVFVEDGNVSPVVDGCVREPLGIAHRRKRPRERPSRQ